MPSHIPDTDVSFLVAVVEHKLDCDKDCNGASIIVSAWMIGNSDHTDMASDLYELACDSPNDEQKLMHMDTNHIYNIFHLRAFCYEAYNYIYRGKFYHIFCISMVCPMYEVSGREFSNLFYVRMLLDRAHIEILAYLPLKPIKINKIS